MELLELTLNSFRMWEQNLVNKKILDSAVQAGRLYAGSVSTTSIRNQQKLYTRFMEKCARVSKLSGLDLDSVIEQIGSRVSSLGPLTPIPGKDV